MHKFITYATTHSKDTLFDQLPEMQDPISQS